MKNEPPEIARKAAAVGLDYVTSGTTFNANLGNKLAVIISAVKIEKGHRLDWFEIHGTVFIGCY